jgi:hypothetical protein
LGGLNSPTTPREIVPLWLSPRARKSSLAAFTHLACRVFPIRAAGREFSFSCRDFAPNHLALPNA